MIGFKSSATVQIIAITCIISFVGFFVPQVFQALQLTPSAVIENYSLWLLLTHVFLHGSFIHLFANMFSLWFIGRTSENILGRKRFISLYFISAVFAGLLSVMLSWYFGFGLGERVFGSPNIAMVGASGAIFGLAGVLAALIPRSKVYLLTGPLFAIIISSILDRFVSSSLLLGLLDFAVTAYIIVCLFSMFSFNPRYSKLALPFSIPLWFLPFVAILPLMIASLFVELYIGNVAHLGGFLVGLVYGLYLRSKYPQKTMMLQRMFR